MRERIVFGLAAIGRWRRYRSGAPSLAVGIGHRQQNLDQRDAVGVTVVDPQDDRAAAFVVADQVELPQRMPGIERTADELAHQRFQLGVARAARQLDPHDVVREVEMLVALPVITARGLYRPLTKARIAQKARGHRRAQALHRDALVHREHAADHHEIARPIHAQPGDVHAGHAFALLVRHGGRLLADRRSR